MTDEQEIKVQETAIEIYRRGIREAEQRIAQLKAAAPVKHPVIALVPCKWEEATPHREYGDIHYGVHEDGATGYFPEGRTDSYPVRRVELCTDVQGLRRKVYETTGHSLGAVDIQVVLKTLGLPADV